MSLWYNGVNIGAITDIDQDGFWMNGRICLNARGEQLRVFFNYMTDESRGLDEDPPFDQELLNEENWSVESNGLSRGITVPAIHPDGIIEWKWR